MSAISAEATSIASVPLSWSAELGARVRGHWFLTLIGTSAFIFVFFLGYFYVQESPAFPVTVMPLTWLDHMIPFQPYALGLYLSLWIYVGAGPGLQKTRREILIYALWTAALCVVGLGIFYFAPTRVPLPTVDLSESSVFSILQRVDVAGNACPSMHVAVAIFTAIRVEDVLRGARSPALLRFINVACCALISYSTLAVKQHVALDVVAGAVLGVIFAVLSLHWRPRDPGQTGSGR
ncbi:MAG: phosphatase PAP2 family protein [Gammaproteobacteria bacterium]